MHAKQVLHHLLTDVCHGMHAARRQAIAVGVVTALRGTRLTVTALGRSIESTAKEKHCIKRADRLLANHDVPTESFGAYVALGHRLIGGTTRALHRGRLVRPVCLEDPRFIAGHHAGE